MQHAPYEQIVTGLLPKWNHGWIDRIVISCYRIAWMFFEDKDME